MKIPSSVVSSYHNPHHSLHENRGPSLHAPYTSREWAAGLPSITPRQSHSRRVTSFDAAPRTASIARPEAKTTDEPVSLAEAAACHRATPCRHRTASVVQRYHGQSATRLQSQPVPKIASRHKASSLTYSRSQAESIIRPSAHAPSAWMKK